MSSKLFSVFYGDGNNRQETYRIKAEDIDQALEWIQSKDGLLNLNDYTLDQLIEDIDYTDNDHAYIMLNNCLTCPYNDKSDKEKQQIFKELNGEKIKLKDIDTICEYCENGSEYFEVTLIEDPKDEDYSFKVIYPYGQNNYIDLTQEDIKHWVDNRWHWINFKTW